MRCETKVLFPIWTRIKKVEQRDKSPKKAFVLGVYASAIHARWAVETATRFINWFYKELDIISPILIKTKTVKQISFSNSLF